MDYVNAGVPGYGLDSVLRNLEHRVRPLRPEIIVIYEATNDLSFDTYELAKRLGLVFKRPGESRNEANVIPGELQRLGRGAAHSRIARER